MGLVVGNTTRNKLLILFDLGFGVFFTGNPAMEKTVGLRFGLGGGDDFFGEIFFEVDSEYVRLNRVFFGSDGGAGAGVDRCFLLIFLFELGAMFFVIQGEDI